MRRYYLLEKKSLGCSKGQLFFLGDNNDNSFDSRFWGMIDENAIYGRAFLISYSTGEKERVHFRKERFFLKLY